MKKEEDITTRWAHEVTPKIQFELYYNAYNL